MIRLLRKWLLAGCCFYLVVSLTGCVYLRLAKVKRELQDFDANVKIVEDEYFSIVFRREILLPEDIVWFMKMEPTSQEWEDDRLVYHYVLVKQYQTEKNEEGNYDLPIRYVFNEGRLKSIDLDKRYLVMFQREFIIGLLRGIAGAKIDIGKRSADLDSHWKWEDPMKDLPDVNDIVMSLGKPIDVNDNIYAWKYLHKKSAGDESEDKYSSGEITFDKKSGKMMKASSKLYNMSIGMDFSPLFKEKEALPAKGIEDGDKK